MAKTMNVDLEAQKDPYLMREKKAARKLLAIDSLRVGDCLRAFEHLKIDQTRRGKKFLADFAYLYVPDYPSYVRREQKKRKLAFKTGMRKLARLLAKHGF